ncbi:MAG: nicotinate (nicotinamide) nucleotide adenylyltransferase [Clostridiales bacterium]|nr:nicotinate (nicotinamide) nucleotide adenylyltransferase [Clostridiales bacterium]
MRIGLLGGTFNPIHRAHVQMARIARDEANLDLVLLMVAADPPHKRVDGEVPSSERLRLAQLALSGEERMQASDLEIRRGGKSYTLLTLLELKERYPNDTISIVIGSDTLADLPNWYHPDEVLALADVLCVPRIGIDEHDAETAQMLRERFGARVRLLSAKADMISSSEIRRRLQEGLPTEDWMPGPVEQAVYEGGEYFPAEVRALQEKCRAALSAKRYRHVCGTMRAAAQLAVFWKQDEKRARIAALLHDCAKCLDPLAQEVLSGDESGIAPVHHAFAGAVLAKMEYGVTDETILRAIRLHTTGEWGMSDFDALIYTADLVEPTRTFPGVEEYRAHLSADIDAFMHDSLARVCGLIEKKGWKRHPASMRAIEYYEEKQRAKNARNTNHLNQTEENN